MTATLTLTFNLPEDQVAYDYTLNAARYKDALKDIMDLMRHEMDSYNHNVEMTDVIGELYDTMKEITEGLLDQ
jgi:hypothetical protein